MFHLYSTRANGWFTESATYTSDYSQARNFTRAEAIAFVRRARVKSGFNLIPVDAALMKEIAGE